MTLDVRIDGQYVAAVEAADPGLDPLTPAGTPGFFQPGNPATGTPATRLKWYWFNWVQESIRSALVAAGLTPDRTNRGQLTQAMVAMAGGRANQLVYTGTTVVTLLPCKGNGVQIQGTVLTLPSAGVPLSNAGLTANTTYYVYARSVAGVVTLDASTTGYVADTAVGNIGVMVKNGDPTRSLVGMVRVNGTGIFIGGSGVGGVRSWHNRQPVLNGYYNLSVTSSSTSFVELSSSGRVAFLCWAGEVVNVCAYGALNNNTASTTTYFGIGLDGTTSVGFNYNSAAIANGGTGCSIGYAPAISPSEGWHYVTGIGYVTAGTGTWNYDLEISI